MHTDDHSGGALVPVTATDLDISRPELSAEAIEFARHALSPATLRAYAIKFGVWSAWATEHGHQPMPAAPTAFANFLSHVAVHGEAGGKRKSKGRIGQSLSTVRAHVAAALHHHRAAGHEFNSKHRAIAYVLKGISRVRAEAPAQAEPLDPTLLSRMLGWLAERRDPWSARDAAMLALGYAAARRRSELVGLDLDEQGQGDGFLARHHDRLEVVLVRHKTAAAGGEPAVFPIIRKTNRLLVAAVDRWLKMAAARKGECIFRRIDRHANITGKRIVGDTVSPLLKRRVRQFLVEVDGVDPATAKERASAFSGHSMRVGLATAAADAGADVSRIMTALGHASPAMSIRYSKRADAKRNSVHHLPGVGLGGDTEAAA